MNDTLTAIAGLSVGHYTDVEGGTGCTVILADDPAGVMASVAVPGQAPASREQALLAPGRLVERVNAILLSGGSAFGLAAAEGVMRWLAERKRGFDVGVGVVPIVPASALFDLGLGANVHPGADEGYAACEAASSDAVAQGSVGAGTGATVGKLFGPFMAMKGGIGSASVQIGGNVTVAAIVAVNAFGDVLDPSSGEIVAGTRRPELGGFINTARAIRYNLDQTALASFTNTTLAVVATDAQLSRAQLHMLANSANAGLARAINPVGTMLDGDTIYALATGRQSGGNVVAIASAAAETLSEAVLRAVRHAESLHGVPSVAELAARP